MKTCPNCNAEVKDEMKFCPKCGGEIPKETKCPNCGNVIKEGLCFCNKCGEKVNYQTERKKINTEIPKSSSSYMSLDEIIKDAIDEEMGLDKDELLENGITYNNRRDYKMAIRYFKQASLLGSRDAITWLGYYYENGIEVLMSKKKAVSLYMIAAEMGDGYAMNNLGLFYLNGTCNMPVDYKKAFALFMDACKTDNADAYANVGFCYQWGRGVEVDEEKAKEYYEIAISKGNTKAQENLKNLKFRNSVAGKLLVSSVDENGKVKKSVKKYFYGGLIVLMILWLTGFCGGGIGGFSSNSFKEKGMRAIENELKAPTTARWLGYGDPSSTKPIVEDALNIKLKSNQDVVRFEVEAENGFGGRVKDIFFVFFVDGNAICAIGADHFNDRNAVLGTLNYYGWSD